MDAIAAPVLADAGVLPADLRRGAYEVGRSGGEGAAPGAFGDLAAAVARDATTVTDAHVAAARDERGGSQDAAYEAVVAAAVGAGMARFEAGMRALRAERE
jgi:hypothetical protein